MRILRKVMMMVMMLMIMIMVMMVMVMMNVMKKCPMLTLSRPKSPFWTSNGPSGGRQALRVPNLAILMKIYKSPCYLDRFFEKYTNPYVILIFFGSRRRRPAETRMRFP